MKLFSRNSIKLKSYYKFRNKMSKFMKSNKLIESKKWKSFSLNWWNYSNKFLKNKLKTIKTQNKFPNYETCLLDNKRKRKKWFNKQLRWKKRKGLKRNELNEKKRERGRKLNKLNNNKKLKIIVLNEKISSLH